MTKEQIAELRHRLELSELAMSDYLGVSVHTYRKWANGTRKLDAAPLRVFELLAQIEVNAPELHRTLLERAKGADSTQVSTDPQKPRKSPKKSIAVDFVMPTWMASQ